jgi:ATP-dependent Clp endopeptidase proteolytic subunit ClpP
MTYMQQAAETLQGLGEVDRITVYLNSLGGSVFDGMTIFNELKNHPARITVKVMGIAASAASVIAMAAEPGKLVMAEGTFLMIHKAWTWLVGNADDMLKMAATLETLDGEMAAIYARRSGKSLDEVKQKMTEETCFTAEEAVAFGLADKALAADAGDQGEDATAAAYNERLIAAAYKKMPPALAAMLKAAKEARTAAPETVAENEQTADLPASEPEASPSLTGKGNASARQKLAELAQRL